MMKAAQRINPTIDHNFRFRPKAKSLTSTGLDKTHYLHGRNVAGQNLMSVVELFAWPLPTLAAPRCDLSVSEHGLDRYWADPSTELLLCGFAFDEDPVQVVDFTAGEVLPAEVTEALTSPAVEKLAWNVAFEVCAIEARLGLTMDYTQWNDPMMLSRYLGLPGSLEGAAIALHLPEGKDKRGEELIQIFSQKHKVKPPKVKRRKVKAKPQDAEQAELIEAKPQEACAPAFYWRDRLTDPEAWEEFKRYCAQDVSVERAAMLALESRATLPEQERQLWLLDQRINFYGLPVDMAYVREAKILIDAADAQSLAQLKEIMGIDNPNSPDQVKKWLGENGFPMESIAEDLVTQALAGALPVQVERMLRLYQKLSGTATTKLIKIDAMVSSDLRLRHQYAFLGTHTHRWSSKGVQMQNFPKPTKQVEDLRLEITDSIRTGYILGG